MIKAKGFKKAHMTKLIAILLFLTCSIFAAEKDKLNVIVIMADDLGYADLSCTGLVDDAQTPKY